MPAPSRPIPLDVLVLVKAEIDPKLIGPHLALSNVSRQVRDYLYPNDRTWRRLLNAAGIGRSSHDLDGNEVTRWWREIAVEVARHEQDPGELGACSLPSVDWLDPSNEGFGEVMCRRVRNINHDIYGQEPMIVYSEEQVREHQIKVKPHVKLEDFDCKGFDCNFLGFLPRWGLEIDHSKEGCLCKDHPVLCHTFATVPPVSMLNLNGTVVENSDGVTQWDVRVAFEQDFPYITQKDFRRQMGQSYKRCLEEHLYEIDYLPKGTLERTLVRTSDVLFAGHVFYEGIRCDRPKGCVEFSFQTGT